MIAQGQAKKYTVMTVRSASIDQRLLERKVNAGDTAAVIG